MTLECGEIMLDQSTPSSLLLPTVSVVLMEEPTANLLTWIWRMRCYIFISVFCLRKGAGRLTQLCPQFRDKMGNVDFQIFTLQHQRHAGDATTGKPLFKDQQIETILNVVSAKQPWLSGKLASVCQQIRASVKCLNLCEKSNISNETGARAATCHPFVLIQQESFLVFLHSTNRESFLRFNIIQIDVKLRKCYISDRLPVFQQLLCLQRAKHRGRRRRQEWWKRRW